MTDTNKAKESLERTLARHRLDVLAGYKDIPVVEILEIPLERTLFPGSESDYWQLIETDDSDNKTLLLYELAPFGIFPSHLHLKRRETCNIITEGAKIEWVTQRKIEKLDSPCILEAKEGEEHALVNHSPFYIKIIVTYSPKMIGWAALFATANSKKEFINK